MQHPSVERLDRIEAHQDFQPRALETGVRGGPEPDTSTLDDHGIPIPEA